MKCKWNENWTTVQLGDCVSILGDGIHGTPHYDENGHYYFINGSNLMNGSIVIKSDTKRVNQSEYEKYKKNLNNRTLLVSINGTIGNIAEYRGENCILGKSACYFNVLENISKKFIKYTLLSPDFQQYLIQYATGTTIKNVSLKQMKDYEFLLPPFSVQQKIATILDSLDKKITVNEAINDNLLKQAQALFDDLFIKHAEKQWAVGHLSELIRIKYGKDHRKLNDGTIPVYGSGGIIRYVERPLYTHESVLIPRKGTLNNVFYINEPFWSVDTMFYTEMLYPNIAKFVYFFLKEKNLASMNSGSAVPSMTVDILNALELRIPDPNTFLYFENHVNPMFNLIHNNQKQFQSLVQLRDTLLPRLMSGELDVSQVDF